MRGTILRISMTLPKLAIPLSGRPARTCRRGDDAVSVGFCIPPAATFTTQSRRRGLSVPAVLMSLTPEVDVARGRAGEGRAGRGARKVGLV